MPFFSKDLWLCTGKRLIAQIGILIENGLFNSLKNGANKTLIKITDGILWLWT